MKRVKVKRNKKTFNKLLKDVNQDVAVAVGHFQDQGTHPSGYTYPELMAFHSKEVGGFDNQHVPARHILEITKFRVTQNKSTVFKGLVSVFSEEKDLTAALKSYFASLGNKIKAIEYNVFGDSELPANSDVTIALKGSALPMIETGELRSKIDVRVLAKGKKKG